MDKQANITMHNTIQNLLRVNQLINKLIDLSHIWESKRLIVLPTFLIKNDEILNQHTL